MRPSRASVEVFFHARSLAVIGASDRRGSLGAALLANVLDAGFQGSVWPVNPRHREIRGRPCFARVAEIGQPVDLAIIATPAATVPEIVDECGAIGVRGAVILSAGFSETGQTGQALQARLIAAARHRGLRFIGPNCLGIMRPATDLNATFSQIMARRGHVALVSQSGAICTAMLDWAAPRGIGFSCVVSSGIAADVDFGEILDYLVTDEETRAVMLYIEGVHDARRFMSGLRALARAKPVVVMKAGRYSEGRAAAISHTGALAGADDVFDAALRRAGVVRVRRFADFFATAETLHMGLRTAGPRLAIVTNGGGPGVVAADHVRDRALGLASLSGETRDRLRALLPAAGSVGNPVDVLGDASAERYADAIRACLADGGVDAVLAIFVPQALAHPVHTAEALTAVSTAGAKPVIACWMGEETMRDAWALLGDRGLPSYETPESAVDAFATAVAYRANQELLLQVPQSDPVSFAADRHGGALIIENALAAGRNVLDLLESKALLSAFGICVTRSVLARDAAEALTVAEDLGFPVAMKIVSPDITHKSDAGGVRLSVDGSRGVELAFSELVEGARNSRPEARIVGVAVEPMHLPAGARELMLGVVNDPVFGPVISVGLGGYLVDVIGDRALGLPPLNRFLAADMIGRSRAAQYLSEFRGKRAVGHKAVEDVLLRLSAMVSELPWLEELDINPLIVSEAGATAVDARVVVKRSIAATTRYGHMAIHPYPVELVREHRLGDGSCIMIRPIRPEDAIMERDFVNSLSQKSRYLRFMYSLRELTPQMLSDFTQIDYDREMALIAVAGSGTEEKQVAVARYSDFPDGQGCEFAIVVADAWQGKGIARELLQRLIDIAGERGLTIMQGTVLSENRQMIALAKHLGFEARLDPDDPRLVNLTRTLRRNADAAARGASGEDDRNPSQFP